jgi:hypothetical protein
MARGWQRLIPPDDVFRGDGKYPIQAYSEFMPPPRVGWKAYGDHAPDSELFARDDPFGWHVDEFEEAREIQPGLVQVGRQVLHKVACLIEGHHEPGIPKTDLVDNPFWPPELAAHPKLPQERCVALLPLALSRTQDDKGRVRWTLFGNSEQGPGKAFWKSFFTAPDVEAHADAALAFFARLLQSAFGEKTDDLHAAGLRVLPDHEPLYDFWAEGPLPAWAKSLELKERQPLHGVRYVLTFRPFSRLPDAVKKAYLSGELVLLPSPATLVFWGSAGPRKVHEQLPLALQVPLQRLVARHRMTTGIKVPQAGFMHEPNAEHPHAGAVAGHVRNTYKRTHRWDRVLRDQDELALIGREDKLLHVLFSSIPDDMGLYDKPMARNVELWNEHAELLIDGPSATPDHIKRAMHAVQGGGIFGYRFQWPAMRVGKHEVYWHRPLCAYRDAKGEIVVLGDAPAGYLTAYRHDKIDLNNPVELWPRFHSRPLPRAALALMGTGHGHITQSIVRNARELFHTYQCHNHQPLPRSLAKAVIALHKHDTLDGWVKALPGEELAIAVKAIVEPNEMPLPAPVRRNPKTPASLTYGHTAKRSFEVNYWKTIALLAEGTWLNKNNADCVRDPVTQRSLPYQGRHLDDVGDYLLAFYQKQIAKFRLQGKALAGVIPFQWRTDFDFCWMGGWLMNEKRPAERDIVLVIPGKDRRRAVIMSDHYDTAYMEDRFGEGRGGCGARIAACGADDNHSATAAMMLAAPIFLAMSRAGHLGCDVWLIHLTGEEFPADCLGARALTQRLVEGTLKLHLPDGKKKDLSKVEVKGLYVSDMIAHNHDHERDIFQIAPGTGAASFWLAKQAHLANEIWNASVPDWNQRQGRAELPRGRRSPHGAAVPEMAPILPLSGQVRTVFDPRSTIYNTDGQVFSDAGVPCVLFMENYDINRQGYHDMHDTMENIDLDYGAALCAITIESVARAACEER